MWSNENHLLRYVAGVLAGNHMIEPALLRELADPQEKPLRFGKRELELINWAFYIPAAQSDEFADKMRLADGTVKNMFQRIFRKLEVHSRVEMIEKLRQRKFRPRDPTLQQ